MIIDVHAHYEPRMLDAPTLIAKMDESGIDRIALIPTMNDPLPHTPDRLLAVVRGLCRCAAGRVLAEGIHRAVFSSERGLRLSGQQYEIYDQPDNASVADLVARHPQRFLGWIFLNPRASGDPRDELERWRHRTGMIGVKLHPHWHDYDVTALEPLLTRIEELRLPVLIHLGFRSRGNYRWLSERFPRVPFIFAHAGTPFYGALWRYARTRPNLYVDLSSPYVDRHIVRAAVAALGPQRTIYGTDSPYGFVRDDSYDYLHVKRWIDQLTVPEDAREDILGGTFARILSNVQSMA
jgi:predicted TIM-barrel fold metal-dependent hydrolase